MRLRAAFVLAAVALAACQGSIGSTPPVGAGGLQPNAYGQTVAGGPGMSRSKVSEAAVKFAPDMKSVAFPNTEGYGLEIVLAPGASPSPLASGAKGPSPSPSPARSLGTAGSLHSAGSSSPGPSPSGSGSGGASPSGSSSPASSASAAPSASPAVSASPLPSPTPRGKHTPPPISVKLAVYPDLAPEAPTPEPDQSPIAARTAIVRGYFKAPGAFTVPSLGAFHFTLPADEVDKSRGFTIALYSIPEKKEFAQTLLGSHRDPSVLIAYTNAALVDGQLVRAGGSTDPIAISAGRGYAAILYGDVRTVAGPGPASGPLGPPGSTPAPGGVPIGPQGAPATPFGQGPTPFGQGPTPFGQGQTPFGGAQPTFPPNNGTGGFPR